MNGRCPFCWNRNVSPIGSAAASRGIMECGDCEKWYWADTGEEVTRLFEICSTSMIDPRSCIDEVRELLNSGGSGFPRWRTAEFNRLCSDCPNARIARRQAAVRSSFFPDSKR